MRQAKSGIEGTKPRPPVKWAGGKGQLLEQFEPLFLKTQFNLYLEPFVGGGAVFFHLQPEKAVLIDSNEELMNFYAVVRDHLKELLADLRKHENTAAHYYQIRALQPEELSPVERASRFLYLNKTGYNGLWRVNRQGRHNVPFGRYKNPKIVDESNLCLVSRTLKKTKLICEDFSLILKHAKRGAFVYLDPPYHPLSATANFTSYTAESFSEKEQIRLAEVFKQLDRKKCFLMLSNSDTELVRELYKGYDIRTVWARRSINCRSDSRGPITELVIRNYS
ncbi:MAG: DNA adenine methylase [Bacillota bacterium]